MRNERSSRSSSSRGGSSSWLFPLSRWSLLVALVGLSLSSAAAVASPCDDGSDLFDASDGIVQLNFTDLEKTVFGNAKTNWLLLLYSSYNGYSIEYANEFKQFAQSTIRWNHTLRIAAVNAAKPHNFQVLQHFNLKGLPALLFVKRMTPMNFTDLPLLPRETELLMSGVFAEIERFVPQLKPVGTVNRFLRVNRKHGGAGRIIFLEELEGDLSRHVILDYLKVKNVQVVWRMSNKLKVGEVRFSEYKRTGRFRHKQTRQWRSVESLPNLLKELDPLVLGSSHSPSASDVKSYCAPEEQQPTEDDLLSSVTDLLSDPCPTHWQVLVKFVRLLESSLADFKPKLRPLRSLAASLPQESPTMEKWQQLMKASGLPHQPAETWKACKDSEQQQVCGLWILLHTLTSVNTAPVLSSAAEFLEHCGDPLEVSSDLKEIAGSDELVSLWRLHNAKQRLQFPSDALCPGCLMSSDDTRLFLLRWYGTIERQLQPSEAPNISDSDRREQPDLCDLIPQLPPVHFTLLLLLLPMFLLLLRLLLKLSTQPGFRI